MSLPRMPDTRSGRTAATSTPTMPRATMTSMRVKPPSRAGERSSAGRDTAGEPFHADDVHAVRAVSGDPEAPSRGRAARGEGDPGRRPARGREGRLGQVYAGVDV